MHQTSADLDLPSHQLPLDWAGGFPSLEMLILTNLSLAGQLPESWISGFPRLTIM